MARGLYEEFLGEIKRGLQDKSHPLNRLRDEKRLLLDALKRLEEEMDYIGVHGNWEEGVEHLDFIRRYDSHHEKVNLAKGYFSTSQDIYFVSLLKSEQDELEEALDELAHVFRRNDHSLVEKNWRLKAISKLAQGLSRREEVLYEMMRDLLAEEDWRSLALSFEEIGYLMGDVELFNPTLRYVDDKLSLEEVENLVMNLPLKLIYKNKDGEILVIKDLAPDAQVKWVNLPCGGKLFYEENQ